MTIRQLATRTTEKINFDTLQGYLDFCQAYLEYVAVSKNLQAIIVSQNESHYQFWQYNETGNYQITRPINSQLMYRADKFDAVRHSFVNTLQNLRTSTPDPVERSHLNNLKFISRNIS